MEIIDNIRKSKCKINEMRDEGRNATAVRIIHAHSRQSTPVIYKLIGIERDNNNTFRRSPRYNNNSIYEWRIFIF